MNADEKLDQLFAAIGKIPSGVFILTAGNDIQETGMLASWVQQCGFSPPMVSVAVNRERYVADWLTHDVEFTLSIMSQGQNKVLSHFAKGFEPGQDAFETFAVVREDGFPPYLSESLGYLHCQVAMKCCPGDHHLLVGEVVGGGVLNQAEPWVHIRKSGKNY